MAWTYGADPLNSDQDLLRLLIGDTDTTDQLLSDAEVLYFTTTFSVPYGAAVAAAFAIAAKYARQINTRNSILWVYAKARWDHYMALYNLLLDLESKAALCTIVVGGFSRAERLAIMANTDLIRPSFEIGQDDDPPRSEGMGPFGFEEP